MGIYLGFDPGGKDAFGVALLDEYCVKATTVSSVAEALAWAVRECGSREPVCAGIDTLLHWALGKGGWRPCDKQLRATYPAVCESIMAPNSLFGAMAIGGIALAIQLRRLWPKIILNETHPKVLMYSLRGARYDPNNVDAAVQWLVDRAHFAKWNIRGEDELDAVLSGWASRKGLAEDWIDIIGVATDLLFPAGTVKYLWPEAAGVTNRSVSP